MTDKPKILIVDDEDDLRTVLSMLVSAGGYEPTEAEHGQEAYELLSKNQFDIVLCDIMMPEMNGLDLLKKCRQEQNQTPFIMISGLGDRETTVQALRLGAHDYLNKPFNKQELRALIQQILKEKKAGKSNRNAIADPNDIKLKLRYCAKSIEGLADSRGRSLELGYLSRSMGEISQRAKTFGLEGVTKVAQACFDCFTVLNVHHDKVNGMVIAPLNQAIQCMHDCLDEKAYDRRQVANVCENLEMVMREMPKAS